MYDFLLVSQKVRQGTVTPVHYNIIYDTTNLNADKFQQLTYKLTHLYYNWPGKIIHPYNQKNWLEDLSRPRDHTFFTEVLYLYFNMLFKELFEFRPRVNMRINLRLLLATIFTKKSPMETFARSSITSKNVS